MPELPEVEALADHLRRHAVGLTVGRVDVGALSVLKTFDPPVSALAGQPVTAANRWGKYLGMQAGELHLITHLSRAGWLRWSDKLSAAPLKPGKGPIALRVHLTNPGGDDAGAGFDLTEAGTQKRLAVWLVTDPMAVPQIAALGPDALTLDPQGLAEALTGNTGRIKTVITDQKVIAGIGNVAVAGFVGLDAANQNGNVEGLAALIFTQYLWAFELTGALLITATLGAMLLAHRERIERRKTQRELAIERFAPGGYPTTLPNPGVYARHNAVDVPARLPDGSASLLSVSAILQVRRVPSEGEDDNSSGRDR